MTGQESRNNLTGASVSGSVRKLKSRCQLGLQSHMKAQVEKDPLPNSLSCLLVGFSYSWTIDWGLSSSVTVCWMWPSVSWQVALSTKADRGEPERECQQERKCKQKAKSIFYNLIMKVTSHHFCHIVFARSKWLGSAHSQGIPNDMKQEARVNGGHFKGCLPRTINTKSALIL